MKYNCAKRCNRKKKATGNSQRPDTSVGPVGAYGPFIQPAMTYFEPTHVCQFRVAKELLERSGRPYLPTDVHTVTNQLRLPLWDILMRFATAAPELSFNSGVQHVQPGFQDPLQAYLNSQGVCQNGFACVVNQGVRADAQPPREPDNPDDEDSASDNNDSESRTPEIAINSNSTTSKRATHSTLTHTTKRPKS